MIRRAASTAAMLMAVAACGGGGLDGDANGQKACDALVQAREAGDDVKVRMGSILVAGKAAAEADTEAIRNSLQEPIEGLEDFPMVDQEQLAAACEDAGVEVPDAPQ